MTSAGENHHAPLAPRCSAACDGQVFSMHAKYLARHRRLSAITFLSNISLDGTHRDTNMYFQSKRLKSLSGSVPATSTTAAASVSADASKASKTSGSSAPKSPPESPTKNAGNHLKRENRSFRSQEKDEYAVPRQRTRTEGQSYFNSHHSSFRDKLSRKFTSSSSSVLCKGNQVPSAQQTASTASSQHWLNPTNNASLETVVDVDEEWGNVRRGRQNSGSHSDSVSASHKSERRIVRFLSPFSRVFDSVGGGPSSGEGQTTSFTVVSSSNKDTSGTSSVVNLGENRLVFLNAPSRGPILVCSLLPYIKGNKTVELNSSSSSASSKDKKRHVSGLSTISDAGETFSQCGPQAPTAATSSNVSQLPHAVVRLRHADGEHREVSYSAYLEPSKPPTNESYDVSTLDDPELIAGRHRTLLNFPCYRTSVIEYVHPGSLKKELNEKFKDRFPRVQLTLSKLRSLKKEMKHIAVSECNIDLGTLAQAFVYFEKAVFKRFVNKQNRKLAAGAALLLSAKLNDVRGPDLHHLIEKIVMNFRVQRRDLLDTEFLLFVTLEFSLLSTVNDVLPHYHRLVYANS